MNQITSAPRPAGAVSRTRRGFLALTVAATTAGTALAVRPAEGAPSNADAHLIARCEEFIRLHQATEAQEGDISPAQDRQLNRTIADVCGIRATSEAGRLAQLKVLDVWWQDFHQEVAAGGTYEAQILGAILRDLPRGTKA